MIPFFGLLLTLRQLVTFVAVVLVLFVVAVALLWQWLLVGGIVVVIALICHKRAD